MAVREERAISPVEVVRALPVTVLVAAFPEQVLRRVLSEGGCRLFIYFHSIVTVFVVPFVDSAT